MRSTTAWAVMWIAVSAAVIASIALTGRLVGLWTFLIPAMIRVQLSSGGEE